MQIALVHLLIFKRISTALFNQTLSVSKNASYYHFLMLNKH